MVVDRSSEQEIQFKKRARRRLVGAIALVLLMVTVLPVILDNHDDQTQQPEIAISIPSQNDTDFTSKVVPGEVAGSPAPVEAKNAEVRPAQKNDSETAMPAKPAVSQTPSKSTETNPAIVPANAAKSSYLVQIGLFSDESRVKQLQGKIKELGIETSTLRDGQKIRLRAGPYGSKEEAIQVSDKLKAAGYQTMLVKSN
ncbi:MAG TPA: SPOR domain-containing protein [Methylophilaceae bacterium]|nr:SPOR domain-containing protein [Methylophilaceae bacterium]